MSIKENVRKIKLKEGFRVLGSFYEEDNMQMHHEHVSFYSCFSRYLLVRLSPPAQ